MITLGTWNLGSVAATVLDLVENVPSNISGTRLLEMADRQRAYIEERTGLTVGSVDIALKYQDALVNLTASRVLSTMITLGADVQNVSIGDFSINKGKGGNLDTVKEGFDKMAEQNIKELGVKISAYKSFG